PARTSSPPPSTPLLRSEELRDQSEESTEQLTTELEDRGLDPGTFQAAAECDGSKASAADDYPNGLVPEESLCALYDDGHYLRAEDRKSTRLNSSHVSSS